MNDLHPEHLGDASFKRDLGVKYAYLSGAMANGIGSADICEAYSNANHTNDSDSMTMSGFSTLRFLGTCKYLQVQVVLASLRSYSQVSGRTCKSQASK